MTDKPLRAPSLTVEDRRSMLVDAVTPLLTEFGAAVTTKQIAERACIAEGTIFRAFGTKEELIQAAVARQLDPEPFREKLRAVDVGLPLEARVRSIVVLMRERFTTVFTLMTSLGLLGKPHTHDPRREFTEILSRALEPDLERLHFTAERSAQIIRMVSLAASMPMIHLGTGFDDDEITTLILYGIAGHPAGVPEPPSH
ncbi:TetR/AcrR family transcriptional regulator [Cryobacterium melibiosiphilum]|uniref:TetR/AcrR family transcriptional regulator n=1 Tax=Cryobacterium melibiosiphilum TaxID=995039 RepID=A0A3A5MFF7_9MICO|nr:TetR/AcrR family transcriptional regulator [Cryobacterium melibiosiphilum]RJT87541.1 TetR/AcrR family transcriptional regulator [Cryobacterium melibiosiphilum]